MTANRPMRARVIVVAGLVVLGTLAAGCGEDSPAEADTAPTTPAAAASMAGMLNDPSATPADQIAGAQQATFVLLDTRPPGTDAVRGTAWLARSDDAGTTLTVTMTGLPPGTDWVGHLHAKPCSVDNGGPHFKFDPAGPAVPPNEVHLGFTAAADGTGEATITNDRPVSDAAKSVVIHPTDALDNRLACAEL